MKPQRYRVVVQAPCHGHMGAYIDVFLAHPAIAAAAGRANVALDLHDWLRMHITLGENAANGRAHMRMHTTNVDLHCAVYLAGLGAQ